MKKVITFVLTILLVLVLSVNVFAAELEETPDATEEIVTENAVIPEEGISIDVDNIIERLTEWWDEYNEEIESIIGFIITAAVAFVYKKLKVGLGELTNKILLAKAGTDAQSDATNKLIDGYNGQTDAITKLQKELRDMQINVDRTYVRAEEALEALYHVAHTLSTVYVNNSSLTQGAKDIVNADYAQIMNLINPVKLDAAAETEAVVDENIEEN